MNFKALAIMMIGLVGPFTAEAHFASPSCELTLDIPEEYQPIFDAQNALREQLTLLKSELLAQIEPTPQELLVVMDVGSSRGRFSYKGRIVGVARVHGQLSLEFLRLQGTEDQNLVETEYIPLSGILVDTVGIVRVYGEEERKSTVFGLLDARNSGGFITYISQSGGRLKIVKGRVTHLKADRSGRINAFVFSSDESSDLATPIDSIVPGTIRKIDVTPQELLPEESKLLTQLRLAQSNGSYVSFLTNLSTDYRSHRFEGWITEVSMNTRGEPVVLVNFNRYQPKHGGHRYQLSEIVAQSFKEQPKLEIDSGVAGQNRARLIGILESSSQPVILPASLAKKLSVFADADRVSGEDIPVELNNLVQPGDELRIYFGAGQRSVRLTVRKTDDGLWAFGDSAVEKINIDERYWNEMNKSKYTSTELSYLVRPIRPSDDLPAAQLRVHMRSIREVLLNGLIKNKPFKGGEDWRKSIPNNVYSIEAVELFLVNQKLSYHLDRGFVDQEVAYLSQNQRRLLAAIEYLIDHGKAFGPYKTGLSEVQVGIYSLENANTGSDEFSPYFFEELLFQSLERDGLKYMNEHWVQNEE